MSVETLRDEYTAGLNAIIDAARAQVNQAQVVQLTQQRNAIQNQINTLTAPLRTPEVAAARQALQRLNMNRP